MADPPRRRFRRRGEPDGPRPLGEGIEAAVERLGGGDAAAVGALFGRWEEIAGSALAEHVVPIRMTGGLLHVAADHASWATQVRTLAPSLLRRVNEVTGLVPERLDVTVRRS